MKFNDRFKEIISEWHYTDDPARDYDEYNAEQERALFKEFEDESYANATSDFVVTFKKDQDGYVIVVDQIDTSIVISDRILESAGVSSSDTIEVLGVNIGYTINDAYDPDNCYINDIDEFEPEDATINDTPVSDSFFDTELWEYIEEAIKEEFIQDRSSNDIWEDWVSRR